MSTVLLIINLFVTLALIGVVLIQRSEGGGLGIGSSQGMGSFMSGRGTANLLTRATGILAAIFMVLCMTLAMLNRGTSAPGGSILDIPTPAAGSAPATAPTAPIPTTSSSTTPNSTTPAPATPAVPTGPSAPTN